MTQHHGWLIKSCTTRDAGNPMYQLVPHFQTKLYHQQYHWCFGCQKSWQWKSMKHWGLLPSTCAPVYSSCLKVEDMHLKRNARIYIYIHISYQYKPIQYKSHDLPLTHFMPDLVLRQETSSESKQCAKEVCAIHGLPFEAMQHLRDLYRWCPFPFCFCCKSST